MVGLGGPSSSLLPPRRPVVRRQLGAVIIAGIAVLALAAVALQQWTPENVLLQIADVKQDETGIFDSAPDLVKQTLALHGGSHSALADDLSTAQQRAKEAAATEYDLTLDAYERREEGLKPMSTSDFQAHEDKTFLEHHFGLSEKDEKSKIAQQLKGMDPEVVHQMAEDMKHPSKYEQALEQADEAKYLPASAAAAASSSSAAAAPDASEVQRLQAKVKKLEHLNAVLAVGGTAGGESKEAAAKRAEKVAALGVKKAEAKAIQFTRSLMPAGADSAAMLRAEKVAEQGAKAETKKMGKETKQLLAGAGKYRMPKLPNIKTDSWGGVVAASSKSAKDSSKIPGVKEDTWPFAPGSFADKKQKPLPGLNEDSWAVFSIDKGAKKGRKAAKHATVAGGCYPDAKGKLHCYGEKDLKLGKALEKALGMKDTVMKPTRAPGTSLASLVPHIRQDAEEQHLNAAAAAFANMAVAPQEARTQSLLMLDPEEEGDARVQELLQAQAQGRKQMLDRVNGQCSTFLDCFTGAGAMVAHHTQPSEGFKYDRMVSDPSQSISRNALGDNFRTGIHPWRLLGLHFPEAGDRHVTYGRNEQYIAHTSEPSIRTPGHAAYDVAADRPSSEGVSQYAQVPGSTEMLAEHARLCDEGGVNCNSGAFPYGRLVDGLDEEVGVDDLPAGMMTAPWTPHMFSNKPTTHTGTEDYVPPVEAMARQRRVIPRQQLELQPVKWGEEDAEEGAEGAQEEEGEEETPEEEEEEKEVEEEMEKEAGEGQGAEAGEGDESVEKEMEEEEEREEAAREGGEGEQGGEEEAEEARKREEGAAAAKAEEEREAEAEAAAAEEERKRMEEEAAAAKAEEERKEAAAAAKAEEKRKEEAERRAEEERARKEEAEAARLARAMGPYGGGRGHGAMRGAEEEEGGGGNLPGVKVDGGWNPYGYSQVWGVDRREGAKQTTGQFPTPCQGLACASAGLPSASAPLTHKDAAWTSMDSIEHSDGKRGIDSVKNAYESVAGEGSWPLEEEEAAEEEAKEEEEGAHSQEEAAGEEKEREEEEREMHEGERVEHEHGEEEIEPAQEEQRAAEDAEEPLAHEEEAVPHEEEEEEAAEEAAEHEHVEGEPKEEEHVEGEEAKEEEEEDKREEEAALADERKASAEARWVHSYLAKIEGPGRRNNVRSPRHAHVMGARQHVMGGGRGVREALAERPAAAAKGERMADLEKVEQAAAGLVADGAKAEGQRVEQVAKDALRDASRDLHQKRAGRALKRKVGGGVGEEGQQLWQARLAALNKLTADVDKVTTADDVSDMTGVDHKLHVMVTHLKAQMAKEAKEDRDQKAVA